MGVRAAILCSLFAGNGVFAQELPGIEAPPTPVEFLPYGKEFLAPGFSNPIQQPVPVDGWELNTSTPLIFGHGIRLADQRPGVSLPENPRNVAFIYDIRQDEMRIVSGLPKKYYSVSYASWVGGDPSVLLWILVTDETVQDGMRYEMYSIRAASGVASKINVPGLEPQDELDTSEQSQWILHQRRDEDGGLTGVRLFNLKGEIRELKSIVPSTSQVLLRNYTTGPGLFVYPGNWLPTDGKAYDLETLQPIKHEPWLPPLFVRSIRKPGNTDQPAPMLFRGQGKPSIAALMMGYGEEKTYLDLGFTTGESDNVTLDAKYCVVEYNRALFLTELVRLSKEQKEAIEKQSVIQKALQVGKMVGVAIHLFFSDNEKMPPKEGFQSEVLPYIKSKDMLSQFVYTGSEDLDLNNADNLDKIEVGFVPGPGGKAVVYADGHVVWVPDK